MQVKATKAGFYAIYRNPGDVFEVPDGEQASWFVPLEDGSKPEDSEDSDGLSRDELKAILKERGIQFANNAPLETLRKLVAESQ